jgi:hypothetical protein
MNKESPKADAPLPLAGTEQALGQTAKQQKSEESSVMETAGDALALDLISDAIDVVTSILE